ncbi:hypothetical protein D1224_05005 [Henriciella barbarensis]|uniref:Uncharacterized protein n=1 Tax=Henriciella barbarensis TaxID=86342 RepID=A0A399QZH9_9PROT|nr:hypothetical protein [Henriciella barbarensis]RIJ23624.1 hypothetical protein D1224_05005 [Henriciella barbarensis]
MNFKIVILAASALLMGACGDTEQDVNDQVGDQASSPEYVYGEEATTETPDLIEGDGSEVANDNTVVGTRVDTGPANMEVEGGMMSEDDIETGEMVREQDGSPETMDETTPQ